MTIFKKIIDKEIPSEILYESPRILAIKDIAPVAPVHILIMPKREIKRFQDIQLSDLPLISEMMGIAVKLANDFGIGDNYRLLTNNGSDAGQSVQHLHFHLIGGRKLGPIA
ncbi:histidine triad nucleotide-binding protein [Chlamydiales bacterium]|nr:histidine triad nucleotide-binding protein [Chlamydiales bacterium]